LTEPTAPGPDRRRAIQRGAFWMFVAALSFTTMITCVRFLENRYPSVEVVFFRALVGLIFVVPPLMQYGLAGLGTKRVGMHFSRAVFAMAAMLTFYYGVAFVPLSDATAYSFIIPLFATVAAALILREHVDAPRWIATIVGFTGTLVILRPGQAEITFPVLMLLLSAAFYAGSWTSLKFLTRTESASLIVFYMNVMIVPLALVPTLIVGTMPTLADLPILIAIGLFGTFAHFCQAKSYEAADASAVMPFDFLRLPLSVTFAWFLFDEPTNVFTWVGAVIIFGSSWFIGWHESGAGRKKT
jgi:drug/metabolite transporter (DMT)-like permease